MFFKNAVKVLRLTRFYKFLKRHPLVMGEHKVQALLGTLPCQISFFLHTKSSTLSFITILSVFMTLSLSRHDPYGIWRDGNYYRWPWLSTYSNLMSVVAAL